MHATSKWHCEFCDFYSIELSDVEEHLRKCVHNPENKACQTCKYLDKCSVKGYPNVINCKKWHGALLANFLLDIIQQIDKMEETFRLYPKMVPELEKAFLNFKKVVKEY